jgi:hypothetical protein
MTLVKLSIGCFLLKLTAKRVHIKIIHCAMLLSVIVAGVFFFVTLLQCNPVSHFWMRVYPNQPGSCLSVGPLLALLAIYSTSNVITDFTFAILPGFILWELKVDKRTMWTVIPLLAMGTV